MGACCRSASNCPQAQARSQLSWRVVNREPTLPGRLVAAAVRWLPAERRDWGAAMAAELAYIEGAGAQWRFAAGCIRVALASRRPWRRGSCPWLVIPAGMVLLAPLALAPRSTTARLAWGTGNLLACITM